MFTSIFNDVLGPVMRGPSSSHTAGSYHIARVIRDLLGAEPSQVRVVFDRNGSYGPTYVQQGVDLAFATGLMGWRQTDAIFNSALSEAAKQGVRFVFEVTNLPQADHPNFVIVEAEAATGERLVVEAKSVGGGTFIVSNVDGCEVNLDGKSHELLLRLGQDSLPVVLGIVKSQYPAAIIRQSAQGSGVCLQVSSPVPLPAAEFAKLPGILGIRQAAPVYYVQKGPAPFSSGEEMLAFAATHDRTLGETVLAYEMAVLGLSEDEAIAEMLRRYAVMKHSVQEGLDNAKVKMLLLEPMAGNIMRNVKANQVAIGGIHAKAAAAAMAVMHACNSRRVVCAAPTGGAAGTLPGVLVALDEDHAIADRQMALMLFAAGGIGLILAIRATFAAEVAGCQVEIGAAGAMAAAAVVEFAGGNARQACDAAAISFQNTMGSVCDLVQGMCEVPCHTRNAVAASAAFTNADMVLGGYRNPVSLDETIDAVYDCGKMLPCELRCTARGGLALAPSALALAQRP